MPHRSVTISTRDELRERLLKVLFEQFGIDPAHVSPSTAISQLSDDSIAALELSMAVEDELDLEIPDSALDRMRTVQEITNYLADRLGI